MAAQLKEEPYNFFLRFQLAQVYYDLGYPDLATAEAYKGLLLVDEASDESGEYHAQARLWLERPGEDDEENCLGWRNTLLVMIASNLIDIGCYRTAYDFARRVRDDLTGDNDGAELKRRIMSETRSKASTKGDANARTLTDELEYLTVKSHGRDLDEDFNTEDLPDKGYVRREIYPWNMHETDRTTDDALQMLNEQMSKVSGDLEVKVTGLPMLSDQWTSGDSTKSPDEPTAVGTSQQLGVFARHDLAPGQEVLRERSLLTANARLHEPMCDACSALLNETAMGVNGTGNQAEGPQAPVPCPDCDDILFCSSECFDLAQSSYHPAVCGMDVETLSKDVPASRAADSLYTLLLYRALAMSQTQETHPLDLAEVKYIWGDFEATKEVAIKHGDPPNIRFRAQNRTLPFSFEDNIMAPLHMLEKMDIDIFASHNDIAELWVWNTLYAKFRGTASARISPRDGRPEVAAVHPLWCLANHSCDPNVQWEWAGEICFTVRNRRKTWQRQSADDTTQKKEPSDAVIKAGDEIWNHYVDIDLSVKERREWGAGALGGACQCERCRWEAFE